MGDSRVMATEIYIDNTKCPYAHSFLIRKMKSRKKWIANIFQIVAHSVTKKIFSCNLWSVKNSFGLKCDVLMTQLIISD